MNIQSSWIVSMCLATLTACAGSLKNPERFTDAGTTNTTSDSGTPSTTSLPNSACSKTAAQVETDIIIAKCGVAGCHAAGSSFSDFATPGVGGRLLPAGADPAKGISTCSGMDLINKASPESSVFVTKLNTTPAPTCGAFMGQKNASGAMEALPDADKTCLIEWTKNLVAGGN